MQTTNAPQLSISASWHPTGTEAPHRLRLLHVEDNASDALLTQEYIRSAATDVEFDAVTRLGDVTKEMASAASCAIVDLSLPDASGLEALLTLRSMCEALPIIVLTGLDDLEVGMAAIRNGAEDYLVKNFADADSMQRAIRYAIERRRLTMAVAKVSTEAISAAGTASHTRPRTASGTHRVAVAIDADHSEYALTCETCGWEAAESDSLHTWAARHLEDILLKHVAFGNREPATNASRATHDHSAGEPGVSVSRRAAFSRDGLFRSP